MRNNTSVHEPIQRFDIVRIPFGIHSSIGTALEVEDGGFDVGFFAFGYFSFAVEIPDGLGEGFGDIGTFFLKGVPDVVGRDDIGFAAFKGTGDTEKANNIGIVCVEKLPGVCMLASNLRPYK